jgi:hypothetical protein
MVDPTWGLREFARQAKKRFDFLGRLEAHPNAVCPIAAGDGIYCRDSSDTFDSARAGPFQMHSITYPLASRVSNSYRATIAAEL